MKSKVLFLLGLALSCCDINVCAQQLAFPYAAGFGRYAVGGRKGAVYHVTNLNDSGTGSLRDAVSRSNRIVVFDVSGVINISGRMTFSNNLYVAGQTAPGEGIIVYGDGVSFSGASNIIVRYMRFRMGKNGTSGKDCAGAANGTNMIFDHCSFSWGLDETFSLNPDNKGDFHSITISNCIIGQGLLAHSAGGLIQTDSVTLYRNLYCDNSTRNNKIKGINQYVNNIVYDWKNGCYLMGGDSEGSSYVNTTNNLFINGPMTGSSADAITSGNSDFHIYAEDNKQDKNMNGILDPSEIDHSRYGGGPTFATAPFDYPQLDVWAASTLADNLLPVVGASLPYRDMADCYMVREVRSFGKEGAFLSNEAQLPFGVPSSWTLKSFNAPTDTDGDGMPDAWESANGTNPSVDDAMTIATNGYANIENYVNSLSKNTRDVYLRAPILLTADKCTDTSISLKWYDFTEDEDGFVLEQKDGDSYREIAKIAPNTESYTIDKLTAGMIYNFRLKAHKGEISSEYANVEAKTQPEYVEMVDCDTYTPDLTWGNASIGTWDHATAGWTGTSTTFSDDAKVLFASDKNSLISVTENVSPKTIVVKGDNKVSLFGAGSITGTTSMNKSGGGELVVGNSNSYTGATVLHGGTFSIASLADGGSASSIGASIEYAQNWIWDGGTWNYTGSTTSTNRSAKIYNDTEFRIANNAVVTIGGDIEGTGGITINGNGTLRPLSAGFFQYEGPTVLKGGTLQLDYLSSFGSKAYVYLGSSANVSSKLVLAGGNFITKAGNDMGLNYQFPIEVIENTYSTFTVQRNCSINSRVFGTGAVEYQIPYVREYVSGDWSGFYGTLIAKGVGSSGDGSQLLFNNSFKGIPNASIYLKGNTRVISWGNGANIQLGGLSGDTGTYLSGADKKNNGSTMTWRIGNANTDETFNGVIDNRCSASGYNGVVSVIKEGSGVWRLTGNNIHKGTTTVSGGRLVVNGTNSGTGAVTVNSNAALAGKGTVAGVVTVAQNGTVAAGDTLINASVLKLNGGCTVNGGTVEIPLIANKGCYNSNQIKVAGSFSINDGVLCLNMDSVVTAIPDDTSFQVFNTISGAAVSGTGFATILPETPSATQKWDTSELMTTGKIYVRNMTTGIGNISAAYDDRAPKYDLNGRRIESRQTGIYIQNGKKRILK